MLDLAIKNGTVVTGHGQVVADVGIEGDKIALLAQPGSLPAARREIDAVGCLVLPGALDIHFHVRAPGHPQRGTFITETQAAAAGGVTTVLEMPISVPCCARVEIFRARRALGEAQSYVNFGLYGAPGLLDREEILGMAEEGACGFKIFTHAIPKGREEEFEGLCLESEEDLFTVLEYAKETGRLVSFHAENERLIQLFERRIAATGRKDPAAFTASRPPVVEAMSVAQLVALCRAVDTHVHIAHVSCKEALEVLRAGQALGLPMTGETCPHYLLCDEEDMNRHGPFAKIKPPLRTPADQAALWQGLLDGALLAITTDHSPFTLEEKERGLDDIWRSVIGAPGVEALVPMVLTEALNGRFGVEDAVRFVSTQPAQLFDLYPRKGVIQPGADADVVVYDPRSAGVVDSSRWFSKARVIERLYAGRPVRGRVATTVVNGVVVFDGGQIVAEAGVGRFVRPA
jgi:allantoinase